MSFGLCWDYEYQPPWSFWEQKTFESALAEAISARLQESDRWRMLSHRLPHIPISELQSRYQQLQDELINIHVNSSAGKRKCCSGQKKTKKPRISLTSRKSAGLPIPQPSPQDPVCEVDTPSTCAASGGGRTAASTRKGISWSPEEHQAFLRGLGIFGKGNWRSIAHESVKSRTPTQVASHAQKYFARLALSEEIKARRRASIHDTTVMGDAAALQILRHGRVNGGGCRVTGARGGAFSEALPGPAF